MADTGIAIEAWQTIAQAVVEKDGSTRIDRRVWDMCADRGIVLAPGAPSPREIDDIIKYGDGEWPPPNVPCVVKIDVNDRALNEIVDLLRALWQKESGGNPQISIPASVEKVRARANSIQQIADRLRKRYAVATKTERTKKKRTFSRPKYNVVRHPCRNGYEIEIRFSDKTKPRKFKLRGQDEALFNLIFATMVERKRDVIFVNEVYDALDMGKGTYPNLPRNAQRKAKRDMSKIVSRF